MCNIYCGATIISLLGSLSLISGILVLNLRDVVEAETQFLEKYKPTTFTVVNVTTGPYRCCEERGCTCLQSTNQTATCSSMILGLVAGTCTTGPQCCRTEWDTCTRTCYHTCYHTCYDRCYDSNGRSYNCRPRNCRPYNCRPYTCSYRCNEHCVQSVTANTCQSYCSNCYRPSYSLVYTPEFGINVNETVVTNTGLCGIDNIGCANEHIRGLTNGVRIAGYYNWENNQDIILGKLEFVIPKKTKDAIITVYFFLAVFGLATIVFGGIWFKTSLPQKPLPRQTTHTVVQVIQVGQRKTDENPLSEIRVAQPYPA